MIDLQKIMLQEEVGENEESINREEKDNRKKNEDWDVENDITMSNFFCKLKRA